MNEFFQICAFAAVFGAVLLFLSEKEKEFSMLATALIYILVCIYSLGRLQAMRDTFTDILQIVSASVPYVFLCKVLGIAFAGAISSSVCEALGQKGLGGIIDLLTVSEILYVAIPELKDAVQSFVHLLNIK